MHEYELSPEVVRVTVVVGVILSMLVYERLQLTTGGALVPAYLAMFALRPLPVVVTLLIGLATHLIVAKGIAKHRILYGRRKFEVEVLIGLTLIFVSTVVAGWAAPLDPALAGMVGIGFLVPGIIAHDMGRQKPGRTLIAITATTLGLAVFMWLFSAILSILPPVDQVDTSGLASVLGYPRELLLLAVAASVIVGMAVFAGFGLRSGGFVSGAYLALVSPRWWDLAFAVGVAIIVWLLVVKVIMPRMLVFGRRKLSTMVLVGALVSWSAEIVIVRLSNGDFIPWRGLTVATMIVPSLIANDAQRQGWEKTIWGVTMTTLGVLAVSNLAGALARWRGWL